MDFIKMIMELPGDKRSQDVVEHIEWNNLWKLIVTQGNHSENYLEQLYDYFFNKEGWVHKVQAELDGVQPYLEGVMTQPVGKAPDGSLWTYPSTESGTVPWGNVMGDITKQQDLIHKFNTKADVGHGHDINTLTFTEGDIDGSWITDGTIGESAYGSKSIPTSAFKDLSVTSEKLNNGAVTTAKIASGAIINDSIANGSVSGVKIANSTITRAKLAQDALYSPIVQFGSSNATATFSIASNGKTNITNNGSTDFVLTVPNTTDIPIGFETALLRYSAKSVKITFASGVKVLVYGNTSPLTAPSFTLETYAMVALKKLTSDTWLLTGPAEVI